MSSISESNGFDSGLIFLRILIQLKIGFCEVRSLLLKNCGTYSSCLIKVDLAIRAHLQETMRYFELIGTKKSIALGPSYFKRIFLQILAHLNWRTLPNPQSKGSPSVLESINFLQTLSHLRAAWYDLSPFSLMPKAPAPDYNLRSFLRTFSQLEIGEPLLPLFPFF